MKIFFSILIPLMALDAIWIGLVAKSFYQKHLGYIFAEKFVLWPAGIFYVLYSIGIAVFVVGPAVASGSWVTALWRGAFLGLIAYGTYDLTNQATIARWPISVTIVDILWGVFVTAAASVIAYFIVSRINM